MADLPLHSPLGASGASRWMACPGSVANAEGVKDEESEFALEGTIAHEVGEHCLEKDIDAWMMVGESARVDITPEMANAVQVYLNAIRSEHPKRDQSNFFLERKFHCPSIHKLFYGQTDAAYVDEAKRTLHVWDYKHGAGIVVEVKENPQCMYYAVGALEELDLWQHVDTAVLHIAQPRGFHFDGPLREWAISTVDLEKWLDDVLIPAMNKAEVSRDTKSGEHCRFCPARGLACPQIMKDFAELEELIEMAAAKELTNKQAGRYLDLLDVAKIAGKAITKTVFNRLQAGQKVPGRKLAAGRANRAFKDGADVAAKEKYGAQAMTSPVLKSPAKIEELIGGKEFTKNWAFKPEAGLTVVAEKDARAPVKRDTKALFTDQTKGK